MNMNMNLIYRVRQFYRYYRNVLKYSSLSPKRKEVLEQDIQFYSQFIEKVTFALMLERILEIKLKHSCNLVRKL